MVRSVLLRLGLLYVGERRESRESANRINRYAHGWYFRSYKPIAVAGRDARSCIPRMLPGLDLSPYDVVVVDADRIDDYPLKVLGDWASSKEGTLLYREGAAKCDDLGYPRQGIPGDE